MMINLMATGAYYACGQDEQKCREYLEHLENDKPEMVLILVEDAAYGIVISVEEDSVRRATIGRGDIGLALSAMHKEGEQSLIAQVVSVNYDGRYFTLSVEVEGEIEEEPTCNVDWNEWPMLTDIPTLEPTAQEKKVGSAIRYLDPALKGKRKYTVKTALTYLRSLVENCRYDVSLETQNAINTYRRILAVHENDELRAFEGEIVHAQNGLGSKKRIKELDEYWTELIDSNEVMEQMKNWMLLQGSNLSDEDMVERIDQTLDRIDDNLRLLPNNLYCDIDSFGILMHKILYKPMPRARKINLVSMLTLREQLMELRTNFVLETFEESVDAPEAQEDKGIFAQAAMPYWEALKEQGFVDADLQRTEKMNNQTTMFVAMCFAEKLGLRSRWKEFEKLWHVKHLAQEHYRMTETGRMPAGHDIIDEIFSR